MDAAEFRDSQSTVNPNIATIVCTSTIGLGTNVNHFPKLGSIGHGLLLFSCQTTTAQIVLQYLHTANALAQRPLLHHALLPSGVTRLNPHPDFILVKGVTGPNTAINIIIEAAARTRRRPVATSNPSCTDPLKKWSERRTRLVIVSCWDDRSRQHLHQPWDVHRQHLQIKKIKKMGEKKIKTDDRVKHDKRHIRNEDMGR